MDDREPAPLGVAHGQVAEVIPREVGDDRRWDPRAAQRRDDEVVGDGRGRDLAKPGSEPFQLADALGAGGLGGVCRREERAAPAELAEAVGAHGVGEGLALADLVDGPGVADPVDDAFPVGLGSI